MKAKEEKLKSCLEAERASRINMQKKSREQIKENNGRTGYQLKSIGHVDSPFVDRRGTPRQPTLVTAAKGALPTHLFTHPLI